MVAGSYMPPITVLGPLHAPPPLGLPVSWLNKLVGAALLQVTRVPLPPAFGTGTAVTEPVFAVAVHPFPAVTVRLNVLLAGTATPVGL